LSIPSSGVALLGIGNDVHSSYLRGPAKAPELIRKALFSPSANSFSELGCSVTNHDNFNDLGDMVFEDQEKDFLTISDKLSKLLEDNQTPMILGGDHAITFPIIKALAEKYPGLSILHFDAHPDLYDELDGDRLSHACPFARIMELGGINRLVQVGIRTMNEHQQKQVSKFGVESYCMHDFDANTFVTDLKGPVYISFDMDALDPAYAPGVSHFEPGGLTSRQAIRIIQSLGQNDCQIIGADVVEYNPDRDINGMTAMVAAKLVKEIYGLMLSSN